MTTQNTVPSVRAVTPAEAKQDAFIEEMTEMINQVFVESEGDMIKEGIYRTNVDEIRTEVTAGHMWAAFTPTGQLAGCVRLSACVAERIVVETKAKRLAGLSMLAVPPQHRRLGVGQLLVDHVEAVALEQGFDAVQLELWVPKEGSHAFKDFLVIWYDKIGYKVVAKGTVAEFLPHLPDICTRECIVVYMQKVL